MIFIDSANIEEIKSAMELGWVSGVTTNPVLLAKEKRNPNSLYREIKALTTGPVFYQLMSRDLAGMRQEAETIAQILGDQIVLKIIPTEIGFNFCSQHNMEFEICITAVFSTIQAIVAANAGARFVAVYYNRVQKFAGDGAGLISDIFSNLSGSDTAILAASLKSPEDVATVLRSGSQHIAAPLNVLKMMIQHDLSDQAIDSFFQDGVGIDNN